MQRARERGERGGWLCIFFLWSLHSANKLSWLSSNGGEGLLETDVGLGWLKGSLFTSILAVATQEALQSLPPGTPDQYHLSTRLTYMPTPHVVPSQQPLAP